MAGPACASMLRYHVRKIWYDLWVKWVLTRVLVFYSSGLEPTCVRWMSDQVCTTAEDKYVTTGRINRVEKTLRGVSLTPPLGLHVLFGLKAAFKHFGHVFQPRAQCFLGRMRAYRHKIGDVCSQTFLSHRRVRLTFIAFKTSRTPSKQRSQAEHSVVIPAEAEDAVFSGSA